jgi:hypothetical protein
MYISKVVECKSLLEIFFFIKEELLNGVKPVEIYRSQVSCDEKYRTLLDNDYYFWPFESGIAYSIHFNNYYKDNFFYKDIRDLNTEDYFKFIINNADRIDKMYKMKAFL